ncbi:hypothetical protein BHE74_00050933 [Ensete ventricosum]|nr:hypothetical protein BHE74_00050933 [Ensete ventricosum]
MKKYDGHKLCAKSRSEWNFDRFSCTVSKIQNTGHSRRISPWEVVRARFRKKNSTVIYFARIARRVEFQSVFRAQSQKFKIMGITNVLPMSQVSIEFSCTIPK